MTNQQIIAKAPSGWTHYDGVYLRHKQYSRWSVYSPSNQWETLLLGIDSRAGIRSREDIERIVELEQALEEVCYDMEWEIENKYQAIRGYASSEVNRKRDLSVVEEARKLINKLEA